MALLVLSGGGRMKAVEKMAKTEESKDLSCGGINTHDTANADNNGEFGLRLNKEVASTLGSAASTDKSTLLRAILFHILLGLLENKLTLCAARLGGSELLLGGFGSELLLEGSLLKKGLRHGRDL